MSNPTTEFLDRVQDTSSIHDRQRAVEGVRAVFRALMSQQSADEIRQIASLLPEDLETLWKPAFYTSLREQGEIGSPSAVPDFADSVHDGAPDLSEDEVRRVTRAVVVGLEPYLDGERRAELEGFLPDGLQGS